MRAITLPTRLLLIAAAAILPLAILCALALGALLQGQRDQTSLSTLGLARALATAVDSELRITVAALQALALAEPMGAQDDERLRIAQTLVQAARASRPEWRAALLVAPDGRVLVESGSTAGASTGRIVEMGSLKEVLETQQPTVGPVVFGPGGNPAFAVRVPVIRDEAVRYVLTAIVRPESILRVVASERVPAGWVASVFDGAGHRVARSRSDGQMIGAPPSESLQRILDGMGASPEAVGSSTTTEGERVRAAVVRIAWARWTVALGAPEAVADLAFRRSTLAYAGGLLLSLALAALAAWWMSRRITAPMSRLRDDALTLGRGEPGTTPAPRTGVAEIDQVSDAVAAAARQRTRDEVERTRLFAAESTARATAEAAEQRLHQLLGASALLSRSLEEASTLQAIASVIVPEVADICRIDLLDADNVLQRKLTHHADPARRAAIEQTVSGRVASSDLPGSFPWAIATGQTVLRNLDDPGLPEIPDPDMRQFVRHFGIRAACIVPLVARGRTIGAMAALQAESGRRFSPEDGTLVSELAQRAALALDNVRLLSDAREAQAQAEVANRAKDEFLAVLGHELRNPLAPIALALQLIARRDDTAFPRERQLIERQVKHLSRMVDDLLDVSRIVSGKIKLKTETLDLRDVIARAQELSMPALQQRASMPELSLPAVPVPVEGDPTRLAQIVCNLLNNALKFTPAPGRIGLSLRVAGAEAQLTVSDEGVGISPQLLPRLFQRFVQGEQALQRESGGLGLGLAIAQSLARLHGGRIQAQSAGEGQGSRFTLHLPVASDAAAGGDDKTELASPRPARAWKLLIVDDNLDAADMLGQLLRMDGHAIATAASAEDALAAVEAELPDGAILDIGLPGMDGYELARRLRGDARTQGMALVALTGYGQEPDRRRALDAGFDDHFVKPVQLEALVRRLGELL